MRKLRLIGALLIVMLSCDKENDLVTDKITVQVNMSKLYTDVTDFNNVSSKAYTFPSGKSCIFPETITPVDPTGYYLTFESLDTGDIQEIYLGDLSGTFALTRYGDRFNLTVTTHDGLILPEMNNQFHWFKNQIIDFSITTQIEVILENPYSAVVVVNNESSVSGTPTLNGTPMYVNENGWEIFTKVEGEEELIITKSNGETVTYTDSYEPYMIYTHMYCDPLSFSITRESQPFITNTQIIFN